jgi:tetratricopeptide (TPR) repeat protein
MVFSTNLPVVVRISRILMLLFMLVSSGCSRTPQDFLKAGSNAIGLQNYQAAIIEFSQAVRLAEADSIDALMAYEGRAMAHIMEHEYDKSLLDFDEAIRISTLVKEELPGAFDFSNLYHRRETALEGKKLEEQYGVRLKDRVTGRGK